MKQGYESETTQENISNLELYKKLIGIWYFSTGLNCLFLSLYGKFALHNKESSETFLMLGLSILGITPAFMKVSKKGSKALPAVIGGGLFHVCSTIGSIYEMQFRWLLVAYVIELLVAVMVIIQNFKRNRRN